MRGHMKSERAKLGMSAKEVASSIGVHENALLRWEEGTAEPLGGNLISLAKFYGVSPEYLLEQTSSPHAKVVAHK